MRTKLPLYATAAVVAVLLALAFTVNIRIGIPYVLLGMMLSANADMKFELGIIGAILFGFIWVIPLAMACILCWMRPYRDKKLIQLLPMMNDLFTHHHDGNYQYDHGGGKK